ncbi:histone H1.01-like [Anoplopoma fimbria]|uniref:histone H1.01-like n=1 Tax=Anoplopoma fimbria TaxID=229290 RepID=UPI0023EABFCA|nr:histone H1.01-like [Anoplopoma fimbria]
MRRKATARKASPRGAKRNANNSIKAKENKALKVIKQIARPTKTPTGKGLGKAGAKRLGRLLKRAIQDPQSPVKGELSLPKTPVRLFKHQIQTVAKNEPKTHTSKQSSPYVPQLILGVVSQCKHRGGISMAELKQVLAAAGYDVTKNNRRVNVVTQRLVNDETLVRTTRHVSFRRTNKTDKKQGRTRNVKPPNSKADLRQRKTASKSSKEAEKSQRQARKTPKPKGKTRREAAKLTDKTRKPAAKSHKLAGKTQREAAKSHKLTGKIRKATAKSHKPRRKTLQARRKSPKPAGKKRRSETNQTARVQKAQRAWGRRQKQNRHPHKTSWRRPPPRRRPRLNTQRRVARRRAYYY